MFTKKFIVSVLTLIVLSTTANTSFAITPPNNFHYTPPPNHYSDNHKQINPGSVFYKGHKDINNNVHNYYNKKRLAERFEMKERRNLYKRNYGHMRNKFAYKSYRNDFLRR